MFPTRQFRRDGPPSRQRSVQQHASYYHENTGSPVPPAPRPTGPKSPAKQSRDKQRSENFRELKGKETMIDIQKELDKTLFFGFNMEIKALEGQKIASTPQAKVLPISTRAIGLTLQSTYEIVHQTMRNIPQCSVYSAYRVSLAQLELKLQNSTRGRIEDDNAGNGFQNFRLTEFQKQEILSSPVNLNVIASLINAAGDFEYGQTQYRAKVPSVRIPHPCYITFSTLYRTVQMLSLPGTPIDVRRYFYERNPLPGAIWRLQQDERRAAPDAEEGIDPLLANPQDFWPHGYGIDGLTNDVRRYKGLLSWMTRKSLRYVNIESRINFDGPGLKTCLVSNYCHELRNADVRNDGAAVDWSNSDPPVGTLDEFWTPDSLDETTLFIGALQLLGEVDERLAGDERFVVRNKANSAQKMDHRWVSMFDNMMG